MIVAVLVVVAALAVIVIALVAVGRVTGQLAAAPPQARFDMPEAVEFVAAALPDDITAQLSYDQLEGLLKAHLDYLNSNDLTDGVRYSKGTGLIVVADDETLGYLLDRVKAAEWWDVTPEQVTAVLEAELAYLESIGAIGSPVPDPFAIEDLDPHEKSSENDGADGERGA